MKSMLITEWLFGMVACALLGCMFLVFISMIISVIYNICKCVFDTVKLMMGL